MIYISTKEGQLKGLASGRAASHETSIHYQDHGLETHPWIGRPLLAGKTIRI